MYAKRKVIREDYHYEFKNEKGVTFKAITTFQPTMPDGGRWSFSLKRLTRYVSMDNNMDSEVECFEAMEAVMKEFDAK